MSNSNALVIAEQLKDQAETILFQMGVDKLLRAYGNIIYTGSYALNLMAWPDIDVHLDVNTVDNIEGQLLELGAKFLVYKEMVTVKLERELHLRNTNCPRGNYLQIKLDIGQWQLPWKLDIWVLDRHILEGNMKFMQQVKQALTPELRELILTMKQSLITADGRTPSFSGYHLYQAILFKHLREETAIRNYLIEQGIVLDNNKQ